MAPIRSQAVQNILDSCIETSYYEDGELVTRVRPRDIWIAFNGLTGLLSIQFVCTICDGSVSRKSDFERHMRKHTGQGYVVSPILK